MPLFLCMWIWLPQWLFMPLVHHVQSRWAFLMKYSVVFLSHNHWCFHYIMPFSCGHHLSTHTMSFVIKGFPIQEPRVCSVLANNCPPQDDLEHGSVGNHVHDLFYLSHAILWSSAFLYLACGNGFECEWSESSSVLTLHRVWHIFSLGKSNGHFADPLISGRLKFLEAALHS